MVLRDHEGDIIFASCRFVRSCTSASEVELVGISGGIELTTSGVASLSSWSQTVVKR